MKTIENQSYEEERALCHLQDTKVVHCTFTGEKVGEVWKSGRKYM